MLLSFTAKNNLAMEEAESRVIAARSSLYALQVRIDKNFPPLSQDCTEYFEQVKADADEAHRLILELGNARVEQLKAATTPQRD